MSVGTWRRKRSLTTPDAGSDRRHFQVTHPFHPLTGQWFEIQAWRYGLPQDRVFFLDSQGRETSIPLAFTDLSSPDPWVVLGAGRSLFRVTDLLEMVDLIQRLRP